MCNYIISDRMRIFCFLIAIMIYAPSLAQETMPVLVVPLFPDPPYEREYRPVTGILGAFDQEVRYLLSITTNKTEQQIHRVRFTEGEINGKRVVIAQTGIGKVNAAVVTLLMIEHFAPANLIFTGIAGGVNPSLSPGDIVIGSRVAYHDYGTLTPDSLWRRPTKNPFMNYENPVFYKSDSILLVHAAKAKENLKLERVKTSYGERLPKAIIGTIVTGDVFVASGRAVKELRKNLHADVTEMEGAAVAQTCHQWKQPFIVIRSLSDNADDASVGDVRLFYKIAAQNSANLVVAMLKLL